MTKKTYLSIVLLFVGLSFSFSQERKLEEPVFSIELKVVGKETNDDIKDAEVKVDGRYFRYNYIDGHYLIKAKIGGQLVVSHPGFETVYYTVETKEDIRIEVEGTEGVKYSKKSKRTSKKDLANYQQNLDSAKFYKKNNIGKSLTFLEENLKSTKDVKRNATTYKVLADIYFFWKQYDLAIENYKTSIKFFDKRITQIQLAVSYFLDKNYEESEQAYKQLLSHNLRVYDSILVYEGLADVYFKMKKYDEARTNYAEALRIANDNVISSKITDLNSRLAEVYAAEGNVPKAKGYFKSALQLATKENNTRALIEQEKVANFYNSNNQFDDEIALRKESLKGVLAVDTTEVKKESDLETNLASIIDNWLNPDVKENKISRVDNTITLQSVNYKIGRAYFQKEDYQSAIPFLKNSIGFAAKKEDLIVQKDATRKLSEAYASVGNVSEANKIFQNYVGLVDKLYIKKQQEIGQAKRFNKKISENQNRISSLEKDRELTESKMNIAYKDKRLAEEINKRQLNLIYTLVAGILLLILLAYLQVRNSRQQKLANNLLALKSMRSQMNPHFIFNALNSVNSYIALNDERNANRYLSEFSVLMRTVLENSDEDFIPLVKEIELIELYVKLEHNRFNDKFKYHVFIDSNINLDDFNIPPMLLQPYIENAIWHGLRYKEELGELLISMEVYDHETIRIVIQDDGIGRKKSKELKTENQLKRKSKGMITIKNRIAILNDMYKEKISVNVTDVFENAEGTKVELLLKKI